MERNRRLSIAVITGAIALAALAVYAQDRYDKYTLQSPSGIAFADFKGYEDWSVVSSARTDEVRTLVSPGGEGQRLHFSSVSEALNGAMLR